MDNSQTRRNFLRALALFSVAPFTLNNSGLFKIKPIHRIGFLSGAGTLELEKYFIDELQKLGFSEGENIHIEMRLARPNTTDAITMAAELARTDLSLIVVGALPFALEVRKNNPRMPMVFVTCPGMMSNGFAKSLERPGSIYTGLDELPNGLTAKRLQLVKVAAPATTRIALISTTAGVGGHEIQLADALKTAPTLGVEVKPYRATSLQELEQAFINMMSDGMNGMLSFQGGLAFANRKRMVEFAAQNSIPAIYTQAASAELGGLMAWAPDLAGQFREAAHYVKKILNGAKPGDLPVKYPGKYYLTLNKSTANKLGLSFPQGLIAEATKIIN